MVFKLLFLFGIIFSIVVIPTLFDDSLAQQMPPHQQWKQFSNIDMMTCKEGHLLLQKTNGDPTCVMPSTYLKLVDRGYGNFDPLIMNKHPEMMNNLMNNITSNQSLMYHWHEMMQKNPSMIKQTMDNWVSQIKDNPELLKNMLGPMTSDPKLREAMIDTMKNHPHMETTLKQHSGWMDSVHRPMMGYGMGQGMHSSSCNWCPNYQMNEHHPSMKFTHSDTMMNMMHSMWINSEMSNDMHSMMLQNPSHMGYMSEPMMNPILNAVMDDPVLRDQMIKLMLEHQDFMNTIRHDNPESEH